MVAQTPPGILEQETVFGLAQFIAEAGTQVIIRDLTTLSGPTPYPNPFNIETPVVNGAQPLHAGTVSIRGLSMNGRLIVGDILLFGADATEYVVQAQALSAANAIAGISILPVLVVAITDGESVVIDFLADTVINALVTSFPARLINGTSIQATDKQVRFLTSSISFVPTTSDKIVVGTDTYSIITVHDIELQGVEYAYSCQCRR